MFNILIFYLWLISFKKVTKKAIKKLQKSFPGEMVSHLRQTVRGAMIYIIKCSLTGNCALLRSDMKMDCGGRPGCAIL